MSSDYIIRRMSIPHCARGPTRCEKYKEAAEIKKICLLQIYYEPGNIARPVIEIMKDGEPQYCEFDVEKIFEDENEAKDMPKRIP